MLDSQPKLFSEFAQVHEAYKQNETKYQQKFNDIGARVLALIQEWEKRLCLYSEKGTNAKYSANLAEKFWAEIRARFSHIDLIGCE